MKKSQKLLLYILIMAVAQPLSAATDWSDINTLDGIDGNFDNPPNAYRVIQYSTNDALTISTLLKLKNYGVGGIQTRVSLSEYLESDYQWNLIDNYIKIANQLGLRVWIHDEAGYPSGAARGLVVEDNPEYEVRGLVRKKHEGSGTGSTTISFPDEEKVIKAYLYSFSNGVPDYDHATEVSFMGNSVTTTGKAGSWQLSVFAEQILDESTQAQSTMKQFGQTGHYPSMLNKDACAKFIQVTHQNYADNIEKLDDRIEAFYSGEMNLMASYWKYEDSPTAPAAQYAYLPWEASVVDEFQAMHGYNIFPYMDALFAGNSEQARTVRLNYYQTIAQLVADNYGGQLTEWAHQNGVKSHAHPLLEEDMICHVFNYGDMMNFLREFDIPGCDLHMAREGYSVNYWMGKYISSAAYLDNKDTTIIHGLLDPIIGYGMSDLTPDLPILKRTVNLNFLMGLNQFNAYFPYHSETDGYTAEEYSEFNEYTGRIASMLRGTWNEAPIAMFYPIATFQSRYIASDAMWNEKKNQYASYQNTFDNLAQTILTSGLDYNVITDDVILDAQIIDGELVIGNHYYKMLVMPYVDIISLEVLNKIRSFSDAGFPVYWVGVKPTLGSKMSEHSAVKSLAASISTSTVSSADLLQLKNQFTVNVSSDDSKLMMTRFKSQNGYRLYYVINDNSAALTISASSTSVDSVRIYNPTTGVIKSVALPLQESLPKYESIIIMEQIEEFALAIDEIPENIQLGEVIELHPNPASTVININADEHLVGKQMKVFDVSGRLVETLQVPAACFILNIETYESGIYMISIENVTTTKFIKE